MWNYFYNFDKFLSEVHNPRLVICSDYSGRSLEIWMILSFYDIHLLSLNHSTLLNIFLKKAIGISFRIIRIYKGMQMILLATHLYSEIYMFSTDENIFFNLTKMIFSCDEHLKKWHCHSVRSFVRVSVRPSPFFLLVSLKFLLVLKSFNGVSRKFQGCF